MGHHHITILLFAIPNHHTPSVICDKAVEYTFLNKYNVREVPTKGNIYYSPTEFQEAMQGTVCLICGVARRPNINK